MLIVAPDATLDPYHDNLYQFETNCVAFAGFSILVWDHLITFTDEIEYIWKGDKRLIVWLFLINRYITPFGFVLNFFAYLSPWWTPERCRRFVQYEGAMTVVGIQIVALMMLIRIRGLYYHQPWVQWFLGGVFAIMTAVNAYLMSRTTNVPHLPDSGVTGCSMLFDPKISGLASASAWLPLLYDTFVFGFTFWKTYPPIRKREPSYIAKRLFEDGLLYYTVIVSITLVLTIMIAVAPDGIKNITAQFELLLTVAMMSRITLNLRKSVHKQREGLMVKDMQFDDIGHDWPPQFPNAIHALEAHRAAAEESTTSSFSGPANIMIPRAIVTTPIESEVIDMHLYQPTPKSNGQHREFGVEESV